MLKKTLRFIGLTIAFFVAVALFGVASRYIEDKNYKKAQTDEFFRRSRMTPEARIAEDQAKALAIKEQSASAARRRALESGRVACLKVWIISLKDPDSGVLENYNGAMVGDDEYFAEIHGRAKNSFGGYVRETWNCRAAWNGSTMSVNMLESSGR